MPAIRQVAWISPTIWIPAVVFNPVWTIQKLEQVDESELYSTQEHCEFEGRGEDGL